MGYEIHLTSSVIGLEGLTASLTGYTADEI
jgi:hypothetical protein